MPLDETRVAAETGHVSDHNTIHAVINDPAANWPEGNAAYAASDHTHSGASIDSLWLPAGVWVPQVGGPTYGESPSNAASAWALDAATKEGVVTAFLVPSGWTTADVDLFYANGGTGSGAVRFNIFTPDSYSDGQQLSTTVPTQVGVTSTAPGTSALRKITDVVTGASLVGGEMGTMIVQREAADAADTLANDVAFLGVLLRKAS